MGIGRRSSLQVWVAQAALRSFPQMLGAVTGSTVRNIAVALPIAIEPLPIVLAAQPEATRSPDVRPVRDSSLGEPSARVSAAPTGAQEIEAAQESGIVPVAVRSEADPIVSAAATFRAAAAEIATHSVEAHVDTVVRATVAAAVVDPRVCPAVVEASVGAEVVDVAVAADADGRQHLCAEQIKGAWE